jgi:hypothetical protein
MANQSMSGKTNYNTDPNHIYYNLQAFNNDCIGASNNVPVKFEETRTSTILANPSEYFLSIQRFSIDTPSLPLFLPEVETDIAINPTQDPNQLIYWVAFYRQGSATPPVAFPIMFNTSFHPFQPPPATLDINAISDKYYYVNQFQDFLDMINQSIQKRYKVNGDIPPPPFFSVKDGNIFELLFPSNSNRGTPSYAPIYSQLPTDTGANTGWSFCMNAPLFTLFSSFRNNYIDSLNNFLLPALGSGTFPPLTNVKETAGWYQIANRPAQLQSVTGAFTNWEIQRVNQMGINNELNQHVSSSAGGLDFPFLGGLYRTGTPPTSPDSFEILTQPYSTAPLWNCVKAIIFTTALFPVANELDGLPIVQNSNKALDTDVQNNNFLPVITDLEVPYTRGDESKPSISYAPSGEYRLIDLQSNAPINNIEISVFWRDQYGTLHPFVLEPGCFSSLKLLFRKKIFNLIYLPEYTKPAF